MTAIYLITQGDVLTGPVTIPVIPGVGVQLPGNALVLDDVLTPCAEGYAWGVVDQVPVQLKDSRGLVYSTVTGHSFEWESLGELPDDITTAPFPGPFHIWQDGAWHLDESAQKASMAAQMLVERDARLRVAATRIAPLQDAVDLGDATELEEAALIGWKRYRVALNRIEQQAGYPANVAWPSSPTEAPVPG